MELWWSVGLDAVCLGPWRVVRRAEGLADRDGSEAPYRGPRVLVPGLWPLEVAPRSLGLGSGCLVL